MKYILALLLLTATACAPTRFVQPLPKDHYAATASLGGPLFTFSDMTIPMPLSSLAVGYGIADKTTIFGGLHTTALAFKDIQLDLGAVHELLAQDKFIPAISVAPVANVITAMRDGAFRIWPEVDLNFYWDYISNGNLIYVTSGNWFELSGTRADDAEQTNHWLMNFGLGHIFSSEHWQYTTVFKYIAAGLANEPSPVEYHGLSGNGTFGVYLALTRKF
jgi:hypothetical protein